jgi:hypothetical protein
VVRRPNGLPLSLPLWMTELTAAQIDIVHESRLALSALLDLRRLVTSYLSSLDSTDSEGSHDAAARKAETPIRRQQFRSRTISRPTRGDSTASNLRAHTVDENAGEDDLRGGGR